MRDPDGIEAPDELGEEPEAPYRPLLTAEEREELRREWLARLAPVDAAVAGREGPTGRGVREPGGGAGIGYELPTGCADPQGMKPVAA
jgi:hypothetical protein